MKNTEYLGRGIHNSNFFASLINGKLKQMLDVINNDKDLDVQIRNDYLNIYYKGGNIARVKSENSIEFDMYYFYTDIKKIPKKVIMKDNEQVKGFKTQKNILIKKFKDGNYQNYFNEAKSVMDEWLIKCPKPERLEQHKLSINNKYNESDYTIIDLEYQVSIRSDFACTYIPKGKIKPKNPRFDIIAINKQGELCVIELKKGSGALRNTSGLKEHWNCYRESIGRNYPSFYEEMKNLLNQKQSLNLIDKQVKIIIKKPKFMFAYAYDDKTSNDQQDNKFQIEYEKIGESINTIKLFKDSWTLLNK